MATGPEDRGQDTQRMQVNGNRLTSTCIPECVLKLFKPHTVGHQCLWVQLIHKLDRILTLVNREARRHSQGQLACPQTVLVCIIQPLLPTVNACAVCTVCAFLSQRLVIKLLLGIGFAPHITSC